MKEDLLRRVAAHISATRPANASPPASEDEIRQAEGQLGFNVPSLLRSLYLNVANGGFGPGYGVIGVGRGRASSLGTLVNSYDQMKRGADYLGLKWPAGLLPFCEWGCNIFSCVDCGDHENRVSLSEECKEVAQSYNLEQFFEMWLSGVNILDLGYSKGKTVEMINPFTREKTRVTSRQLKKQ